MKSQVWWERTPRREPRPVRLLLGLYRPQAGCILLNGRSFFDPAERYGLVSGVFQTLVKYLLTPRQGILARHTAVPQRKSASRGR